MLGSTRISTPFQVFENKNKLQKTSIKDKINNIKSPRNFCIDASPMKTKDFFNPKNLEKFEKKMKEKENNNSNNIPNNRKFNSKENLLNNFKSKVPIKLKRLENNVLMIDTCNINNNNNNEKFEGKIHSQTSKNIFMGSVLNNNIITTESKYENQKTGNTEFYFYNKNLIENGELKNLMKYKKRPKTISQKEMSVFASKSKRFLNRKEKVLEKNNEINNAGNRLNSAYSDFNYIKPKVINRQHSSTNDNKHLSGDLFVRKLDRVNLGKVRGDY